MNKIQFCKMHGLGNDFMVVDAIHQTIDLKNMPIASLADRHLGIGFDQLLLITPSSRADFGCRIFNSDGTEAEQCGNGMRCVARFVHEEQLVSKKSFMIETLARSVEAVIHDYNTIQITMGTPSFEPQTIPFIADKIAMYYELPADTAEPRLKWSVLSMGNPHAILHVNNIKEAPLATIGPQISKHPAFPKGANVGFMEIVSPKRIRLRTYERGVGETFACGSNTCAAVVAGILNHNLDHKVTVELAYGDLLVEWADLNSPVILTGPAARVFSGTCLI